MQPSLTDVIGLADLQMHDQRGDAEHVDEALAPFDHHDRVIEAIAQTELVELEGIAQPVEIGVDEHRRRLGILVDQSKGRAGDRDVLGDTQRPCHLSDEEGFPRPERSFQQHQIPDPQVAGNLARQRTGGVFVGESHRASMGRAPCRCQW